MSNWYCWSMALAKIAYRSSGFCVMVLVPKVLHRRRWGGRELGRREWEKSWYVVDL